MVAKMATIVGDVTGLQQRHRPLNIPPLVKGTQSAMGSRWPGHYFCQFQPFTSTRNQSYASDTSRNPLQSCLVSHSILDLLLNRKPLFEQTFAHPITLFYHIFLKNGIQRNTNRKGKSMGEVTYIWKIKLSRRWTFNSDSDLQLQFAIVQLFTSTDVRIQKYSSMFGFLWKNPSVSS